MTLSMLVSSTGVCWPDLVDAALWPMSMEYAVYIYNHTPSIESGQAPIDLLGDRIFCLPLLQIY